MEAYAIELKKREAVPVFVEGFYFDAMISTACAIYLQPLIDGGEFNADRVAQVELELMEKPILQFYPVGFFFLKQYQNFGKSRIENFLQYLKKMLTKTILKYPHLQRSNG
jgi:hypothetical protein